MDSEKLLPGTRTPKHLSYLAIALILLSPLALLDASHAAGRVFYDDFEDGTTNKWGQDGSRNRCTVVTSAADGLRGPYAGSRMARCNWNGTVADTSGPAYETLKIASVPYTNEIFYRVRLRIDRNVERTNGSPLKLLRIFYWDGDRATYRDLYENSVPENGLSNRGAAGTSEIVTYWGETPGDNTGLSTTWHTIEYYFSHANGQIRVWHDGILIRNDTASFNAAKWLPFYLTSNYSDQHDATNYIYFDNIEIYSDAGNGATGLMSNATISASGSGAISPPSPPQNLRFQ